MSVTLLLGGTQPSKGTPIGGRSSWRTVSCARDTMLQQGKSVSFPPDEGVDKITWNGQGLTTASISCPAGRRQINWEQRWAWEEVRVGEKVYLITSCIYHYSTLIQLVNRCCFYCLNYIDFVSPS